MEDPNYIKITTGLFIMLNPFVLIPVFLALTGGMTKAEQMKVASTTSLSVLIIMLIAVFAGNHVLSFFGIPVSDFRIERRTAHSLDGPIYGKGKRRRDAL